MHDRPGHGLAVLVEKMVRERGFGFDAYKESCLRRRVAVRMRACHVDTYESYAKVLDSDRSEYDRLLDALTVNVTKFYRNPETWDVIAQEVLPELVRGGAAELRCWSAGCASGEEPYTLAVLLDNLVVTDDNAKSVVPRIDATDIDPGALTRATAGEYAEGAFDEMPAELTRSYFTGAEVRRLSGRVKQLVRFFQHDIVSERPPAPPYDLIICRNVLIYFDRTVQERVIAQFVDALRPGGFLVLGRTETLPGEIRMRLSTVHARERIYRRP